MKVQGHLTEYPLRDLLTILTKRRETGRLQIDFESGPGIFHLKDGKLIDARVGPLVGFSAVNLAFSLTEAPFHFDTLTTAPEATISVPSQRLILTQLLGIWVSDAEDDDFDSRESIPSRMSPTFSTQNDIGQAGTTGLPVSDDTNRILLTARETLTYVRRHSLAASAAAISVANRVRLTAKETLTYVHKHALAATTAPILLLVPAVIALTVSLSRDDRQPKPDLIAQASNHSPGDQADSGQSSANHTDKSKLLADNSGYTAEKPTVKLQSSVAKPKTASASAAPAEIGSDPGATRRDDRAPGKNSSKLIAVVVHIEEGRVSEAYVDHHPGLEAYEATAIRLARQRRYSKDKTGTETTVVKVTGDQ